MLKNNRVYEKIKSSWPFLEPVFKEDATDYYDHIHDQLDLKSIEKKL